MKALVLREHTLQVEEHDKPEAGPGEVLVKVHYAALNHRDQYIREGKYPGIRYPAVLGSDACGIVTKTGQGVDTSWEGRAVVINPNIKWGDGPFQSREYQILGMPAQGTLAEYIAVNADRIHPIPEHLDYRQAAALPLAAMTAYNALFNKGQIKRGMNVLISGVGGGVAQFAFQFALAMGARVWVTSSKEEILSACMEMGAAGRRNYHHPDAFKLLKQESGGFDILVDSACGPGMNDRMMSLKPGGRYVFYGATTGRPADLNVHAMFWNHWSLHGSTMGSDKDFTDMLDFISEHRIEPVIDHVFSLVDSVHGFDRMKDGFQFGKILVDLGA